MISETLSVGLEKYQIGPKLRKLRLRKKLGLTELGRHTGLSAGMLSKIERGLLFPTLPTLLRIALVFNTGLEHFFSNEEAGPQIAVVRKNQRLKFPNPPGGKPSDLGERDRQLESGQSSSSAGSSGAAITDEYEQ